MVNTVTVKKNNCVFTLWHIIKWRKHNKHLTKLILPLVLYLILY